MTRRRVTRRQRITRRRFLGRASAAAALPCVAPWILPSSARGADGTAPPSERINLGFIGTGGRGLSNMRSLMPLAGARVVAVCDVRSDKRRAAAATVDKHYGAGQAGTGACREYNDFRELLACDDVDAVVISPQDHWHGPIAVAAARAGKDMYCEKPLGVAVAESQAIRDAVRRHARVFQTGTQQRSDAKFRQACSLARSGRLGKVHTVEVAAPGPRYKPRYGGPATPAPVPEGFDYDMYLGPALWRPYTPFCIDWPGWYLIWDLCAGFIVNWGVHHLDIAHWGMPSIGTSPCRVRCKLTYRTHPVCDNVNSWQAELLFDDGLRMPYTDTGNPLAQGTRFIGAKGWVHVNRKGITAEPASLLDEPVDAGLYESNNHHADFLRAVRERRDPVAPVEGGHVASYLGMIAESAGRLGRELRWDPAAERFVDDPEANRLLRRPMRSPWRV